MNIELRDKWIAALNSDDYAQGQSALRKVDATTHEKEYCCLGVLCDLIDPDGWHEDGSDGREHDLAQDGAGYLNGQGLSRVGLTDSEQRTLAGMNDNGAPFAAISRAIEGFIEGEE